MIGLGLDFDSRTSQNLIDFFPSHTISVKGSGKNFYPINDNKFGFNQKKFLLEFRILSNIDLLIISEEFFFRFRNNK